MIPYSRPKLSDLYTLSQSKLLGNHYTLHRGTYLYSPYMAVLPPPLGVVSLPLRACVQVEGVTLVLGFTLASGLKIARIYEQIFTGRVTTRLNFTSTHDQIRLK